MSEPYVGEIRLFAGNFAPVGWAICDGSLVSIAENELLFVVVGTTHGGDGVSTFALPDLRGRVPVHVGTGHVLGEGGGAETVTLTTSQIPAHTHALHASDANASTTSPTNAFLAAMPSAAVTAYGVDAPHVTSSPQVGVVGGSQPHDNMQPYVALNYIIALYGLYPSRP
ncbi:phage tail protein [Sandaracinus amylolyticus]|uniref:Microcystin dependent protein n=1 Tax=Sandaracinus amylolyticus TaxID=927083 RepID=A0A0F6W537_9BACT|nr:tail fiber protein [Sandaracinus amylolyticus]AKF07712.1 Microcystin dependent protein [Sandaracinus amylolyticus]